MLQLLADENFNGSIFRGLLLRSPELDLVRVQDVGLTGIDDEAVLEWAAARNRLLLTHDFKTIPKYAYERLQSGLPMPGVIVCDVYFPVRDGIDEIQLIAECSDPGEYDGLVIYLPL